MAAVQKARKEHALKPKHRRVLKNLAKSFHAVGINIESHIETFEIEEEELNEIRKRYGTSTFLGPRERTMLKDSISNLISVIKALVVLEELVWKQVAPYVYTAAQRKEQTPDLLALKTLRILYDKPYQKSAVDLKTALPHIRKYLLGSFAQEQQLIFKKYQRLLGAVEANLEDLMEIENRADKISPKIRSRLMGQISEIRSMLFEDIYYLTRDIAKLYDIRVELYKWLIQADNAVQPRILPTIEMELGDILAVRNYYIENYRTHLKILSDMYSEEVEA